MQTMERRENDLVGNPSEVLRGTWTAEPDRVLYKQEYWNSLLWSRLCGTDANNPSQC